MLKKQLLLGIIALLFLASSKTASSQQPNSYWYFAVNNEAFIAFSSDGTSGAVLQKDINAPNLVEYYERECYQVGPQTALIVTDEAWHLLTPNDSKLLPVSKEITSKSMVFKTGYGTHSIFMEAGEIAEAALLLNAETGSTEWLTGEPDEQFRFSADGHYLYYASVLDSTWTLWERELATGTESAIFSWQNGDITPNDSGEYWLYHTYQNREGIDVYTVVSVIGEQWEVGRFTQQERLTMQILDNALVTYHPRGCKSQCEFKIQDLPHGPQQSFVVSNVNDDEVIPELYSLMDDSELLLSLNDEVWLVSSNGESAHIGFTFNDMGIPVLWTNDDRMIVMDARLSGGETSIYAVWDRQVNDYVWMGPYDTGLWLTWLNYYPNSWLLLENLRANKAILYLYRTGQLVRLPAYPYSRYFGVTQPDGKTLYGQFSTYSDMDAGIYLYDPSSESYQTLISGKAWMLCPVVYQLMN